MKSSYSSTCIIVFTYMIFIISGCSENIPKTNGVINTFDYSIDTSAIPKDTIDFNDPRVTFVNGSYFFEDKEYSGIVFKILKGYDLRTYSSVLNGNLHGTYRSFFASGKPYEVRQYKNNVAIGRHYGYWEETGNLKFEYHYYNQKKEGSQKNWYADGKPYYHYNYKDDHLDGPQKAWRSNGSLYRNFVVKDGIRYGLQKSAQCYEVSDEEIK